MALIRTQFGDTEADVTYSRQFMAVGQVAFQLSLANDQNMSLLEAGAFNAWRPLAVRMLDGNPEQGGSVIDRTVWVVGLDRDEDTVSVTAYDAAKWFERRSATRVTARAQPVGQHVLDLFANVVANREERPVSAILPDPNDTVDSSDSSWFYLVPYTKPDGTIIQVVVEYRTTAPMGTVWGTIYAHDGTHSAANRRAMLIVPPFTTVADPVGIKVRIWSYMSPNVLWSNTLEVSTDQGQTWGTPYRIAQTSRLEEQWIDITDDHAWTAADLAGGVYLRFTEETDADDSNPETVWNLFYVGVQCDFATNIADNWPVRIAQVDNGGPVLTLPDNERKSFLEWLSYLSGQTGYEWEVQSDFNQLGTAGLAWLPRLGTDMQATVTRNGQTLPVASLEEGQIISKVSKSSLDGTAIYSQVRVTATGNSDVIQTNLQLAADIGVHEYIDDMGQNATVDAQTAEATTKLAEIGNPAMAFSFDVPRLPGLWAALALGNTTLARFAHAPIFPWAGTVRIVGQQINEAQGTMTLDVLSVSDDATSSQPIGQGHQVQSAPTARKNTPVQRERNRFTAVQNLIRRLSH